MYDFQNTHNKKYRFLFFCYGITDTSLDRFILFLFLSRRKKINSCSNQNNKYKSTSF